MNNSNTQAGSGFTVAPVAVPGQPAQLTLEFLRLPRGGQLCPFSGLSRSYLNSLILPTEDNGHRPPVKSVCLRRKGAKTGVRLISVESLRSYLHAHLAAQPEPTTENPED